MINTDFDADFMKFLLKFELLFSKVVSSSEPKIRIRAKSDGFLVFLSISSFQKWEEGKLSFTENFNKLKYYLENIPNF